MRQLQEQGHKTDTWTPYPGLVPTRGWRLPKRHIPRPVVTWATPAPLPGICPTEPIFSPSVFTEKVHCSGLGYSQMCPRRRPYFKELTLASTGNNCFLLFDKYP